MNNTRNVYRIVQRPVTPPSAGEHSHGRCQSLSQDNSGPPSKRSITCLVYLNPDWTDGDGGELVLHPFLEPDIIIAPLMRRAVFPGCYCINPNICTCLFIVSGFDIFGKHSELSEEVFFSTHSSDTTHLQRFFRSDLILHSVRPSSAERFCFTLWLDGPTNSREDVNLTAKLLRTQQRCVLPSNQCEI